MLKIGWRDFFLISRRERNGILCLAFLLSALMLADMTMPLWAPARTVVVQNRITPLYDTVVQRGDTVRDSTLRREPVMVRVRARVFESGGVTGGTVAAKVGINSADSAALESLPGFGPALASRIVKYRRQLGGFFDKRQLMEVYGMQEEYFNRASPYLVADTGRVVRIPINFCSVKELASHPYIGYRRARMIVRERDRNGMFTDPEELSSLYSGDTLAWITHYLLFSEVKE